MKLAVALFAATVVVTAAGINEKAEDSQAAWWQDGAANRQASTTPAPSESRPTDCADILMAGNTESGVYEIYPFTCTCNHPINVYCDMDTDGGGWTVFLKRNVTPSTTAMTRDGMDFNRTWDEYKNGFGDVSGEHWLGNEMLHVMTHGRAYTLRMDMTLASGALEYATLQTFRTSNEVNRYLTYGTGSILGSTNGRYCFNYVSGRYFSTMDRDNEYYSSGNCAAEQGGGFWYYNCNYFNPTSAINETIRINCYNRKFEATHVELKIRPTLCDESVKIIHKNSEQCGCNN